MYEFVKRRRSKRSGKGKKRGDARIYTVRKVESREV